MEQINSPFMLTENTGALHELKINPNNIKELIPFVLSSKQQITHDSFIFTFDIPNNLYLGLNIGNHIAIHAIIPTRDSPQGEEISRKYTPISLINEKGKFEILIKIYKKNTCLEHPDGGLLTQYMDSLKIGSEVLFRGPLGRVKYYGNGFFKLAPKKNPILYDLNVKRVGMLCGGTGIAPLYQFLQAADNLNDTIEYSMIFANKTSKDILLKDKLDNFEKNKKFNFNINYTIDNEEEGWTGLVGHINKNMIEKYMPPSSHDTLLLLCGRKSMCKKYLTPILNEMGYDNRNIFIF